jgi:hypothetical protein
MMAIPKVSNLRLSLICPCAAVLALAILAPEAKCQVQNDGSCRPLHAPDPANFSGLTFTAVGDLITANGAPSSGVKPTKGGSVGIGKALLPQPRNGEDKDSCETPGRRWTLLVETNFLYNQSNLQPAAITQAIEMNPQTTGLIGAVSGKAKYFSWTVGPTFQVLLSNQVRAYFFGGSGWFRRTLDFTGASTEGPLLQAGAPLVFGQGGNSLAVDGGAGVDFGRSRASRTDNQPRLSDIRFYVEFRAIRGLAINHGSFLLPVSAGIRW